MINYAELVQSCIKNKRRCLNNLKESDNEDRAFWWSSYNWWSERELVWGKFVNENN